MRQFVISIEFVFSHHIHRLHISNELEFRLEPYTRMNHEQLLRHDHFLQQRCHYQFHIRKHIDHQDGCPKMSEELVLQPRRLHGEIQEHGMRPELDVQLVDVQLVDVQLVDVQLAGVQLVDALDENAKRLAVMHQMQS